MIPHLNPGQYHPQDKTPMQKSPNLATIIKTIDLTQPSRASPTKSSSIRISLMRTSLIPLLKAIDGFDHFYMRFLICNIT